MPLHQCSSKWIVVTRLEIMEDFLSLPILSHLSPRGFYSLFYCVFLWILSYASSVFLCASAAQRTAIVTLTGMIVNIQARLHCRCCTSCIDACLCFSLNSMIFRFDLIRTNQCVGLDLSNLLMICNRENMSGFCRIGSSIRGFCLSAISPGQAGHEHEPDK